MSRSSLILSALVFAFVAALVVYELFTPAGVSGLVSQLFGSAKPERIPAATTMNDNQHIVTIETAGGVIEFETYDADAPKAVRNFIALAEKGFYNDLVFHRVIKGFMIQGGDPLGDGTGGPGYVFDDELNPATESYRSGYRKGVVAMANRGPNTNGSQFFIMLEDYPLARNYTIFGKVIRGQEIVDAIGSVPTDANDRPLEPVSMRSVTVREISK